jgi:hypothetical protein
MCLQNSETSLEKSLFWVFFAGLMAMHRRLDIAMAHRNI